MLVLRHTGGSVMFMSIPELYPVLPHQGYGCGGTHSIRDALVNFSIALHAVIHRHVK